jgi:mono/diheme cytochrome c family protein
MSLPDVVLPARGITRPERTLESRVTGDLAISPRGDQLAVPALYVNTFLPDGLDDSPVSGDYANSLGRAVDGSLPRIATDRTTPAVVFYELTRRGDPKDEGTLVPTVGMAFERGSMLPSDARRSHLTSLTYSLEGLAVFASMESSGSVVAVPTTMLRQTLGQKASRASDSVNLFLEQHPHLEHRPVQVVQSEGGPRGVAILPDGRAFVDVWLDHGLQSLPTDRAMEGLSILVRQHDNLVEADSGPWIAGPPARIIAEPTLHPDVEEGRRLFITATDPRMSAHGSGTACATCHFEGRTDGLTWEFSNGRLQTPSLAGPVSETAPVTWLSSVPSVADEAMLTSSGRMGGEGLVRSTAELIAAFVDSTPYPTAPPQDLAAVERGRAIFTGSAQCASCHVGELLTDNLAHAMFDRRAVRTPTLRGIAATPPYLHDGRAATLEELIDITEAGGMGRTSHLSASEKADLVAFLKSL